MNMNTVEGKGQVKLQKFLDGIRGVISSNYFPFITAAVTLLCYYLSLDIVLIWYMAICGTFILLFMRDSTPLVTVFLFMNIMISMKNSPTTAGGNDPSDYYFQTVIIAQIGVAIGIFVCAAIYRMVCDIRRGEFKVTPVFYGLCAFAIAITLNGLFSGEDYTPMNLVYGLMMAFFFLGIFVICFGSISIDKNTFERVAVAFIALTICLIVELIVAYCTYDNLWDADGSFTRGNLIFGWGIYNTMGMLFTISMPSAAYLALKRERGYLFTAYLVLLIAFTYLTMSRQAMLCGAVVFITCAVWILVKSPRKARIINIVIFAVAAVAAVIILVIFRQTVAELFAMLTDDFFSGSGRDGLYSAALEVFIKYPIFGSGFYHDLANDPGFVGLAIIPDMYHNTVLELLAVGGLVALIPYVVHRVQTIISFVKNPSGDRFFVALTIFALLILSLFDNHIFYILPTLVYSFMTTLLVKSEKVRAEEPARALLAEHNR